MSLIRIRKWDDFQHYKDGRKPVWLKLHRELTESRTWVRSSSDDQALMIALMVMAAKTNNEIENDPEYIQTVCHLKATPNFDSLVELGFIRIEGEDIPQVEQPADNALVSVPIPIRKPKKKKTAERFEDFWRAWPRKRDKKRARSIWENRNLDNMADEIIRHVVKRAAEDEQWLRDDGKYIPHPTTFLNGDRWEDSIEGARRRTDDLPVLEEGRRW